MKVKLIDFGYLIQGKKEFGKDAVAFTCEVKGTNGYYAPELLI